MQSYRLTFWGKHGRREGTCPLMAYTDRDALERGSKMLSRSDLTAIEVWRDTSLISRLERQRFAAGQSSPLN